MISSAAVDRGGVHPGLAAGIAPEAVEKQLPRIVSSERLASSDAGGYAGTSDGYQTNGGVPAGLNRGAASLQVSVAGIAGGEVKVAIQ